MTARCIIIITYLLLAIIANSQVEFRASINPQELNEYLKSLNKKLEDTRRIDILLILTEYNLRKDGEEKQDLDSATTFLTSAKELNSRQESRERDGLIFLYEATLTRERGDKQAAKQLANQAISQFKALKDNFRLALAYLEISRCYDSNLPAEAAEMKTLFNSVFDIVQNKINRDQQQPCLFELHSFYVMQMKRDSHSSKLDFLEPLVMAYQVVKDKINEFWTRKEIADIHYQQGKLDIAIKEALQIAKEQKAGGFARICYTYELLALMYQTGGDYEKALFYSLETVKNVSTKLDSFYLANFYAKVAYNYSQAGNFSEALQWHLKRLNHLIETKRTDGIYGVMAEVVNNMIKLGRGKEALELLLEKRKNLVPADNGEKRGMLMCLIRCYAAVNRNDIAAGYCDELIKLTELRIRQKEIPNDPTADQVLSRFYLNTGQFDKAELYHRKVNEALPNTGKGPDILFDASFNFKLDSGKGNYFAAIKHLQLFQQVKDSIFTATKSKQIEELRITYETNQKDQLISFNEQNIQLLTKQDQLQKSKLQQGAVLRNISFAVVGLLIIITALLFSRYKLKQRTNRKLETQQGEIAKQNDFLQHLVKEKEWLLKEIHHRVKNNLQTVTSLLGTQSRYLRNEVAVNAITDSQRRIQAMSLIHQKLYQANNLSAIKMRDYIHELVDSLRYSFNLDNQVRFNMEIMPIELDLTHCIPLGLILNEAITNSFKYAFPGGREGNIYVSLKETEDAQLHLMIRDNGIGLPSGFNSTRSDSMGMSLMRGLSEEIGAHFNISGVSGTRIDVSFTYHSNIAAGINQIQTETIFST